MSFNLTEKPEMFGIPIFDFYILLVIEAALLLIALWLIGFNIILGGTFFVFFGGIVFVLINFKKFMPQHFFLNLFNFTTGQRLYLAKPRISADSPLVRAIAQEGQEAADTEFGK